MQRELKIAIITTSPNVESLSRISSRVLKDFLSSREDFFRELKMSLTEHDALHLPPTWTTKGGAEKLPPPWQNMIKDCHEADAVIFSGPIYYYCSGSPTMTIVENLGTALSNKPIMIVSAAGSLRSHTASGTLMQNLIFERQAFIHPKTVVVTAADVDANCQLKSEIIDRLKACAVDFLGFAKCISNLYPRVTT